jgi:hypothetical protein
MTTLRTRMLAFALGLILTACADEAAPTKPSFRSSQSAAPAVTFVGAGDIAGCASPYYHDEATAELIKKINGTVFTAGDLTYPDGTPDQYRNCYHPSWGQFRSRTRPSPGNHDYETRGAAGYFGYFGTLAGPCCRGYYTYVLGGWRIYSLNSEMNLISQLAWLKEHLASHPAACVLAYWHKPLYSAGTMGPSTQMYGVFKALYRAGAELVLTGHDHNYQRFAPMDADAHRTGTGVRQFVVGTGGAHLADFPRSAPNLESRAKTWGVLKLTLMERSYGWDFISTAGKILDSGTGTCH